MKLKGLIAATYTPFTDSGELNLHQIPAMVEHLVRRQVDGFYVCGSTGEGVSMTSDERRATAEAYVSAAESVAKSLPVVVQVGHNSLKEATELAKHAASIGATAFSANAPSYFKVTDVETLVDCMAQVASGAPDLPFYYYHIPVLTGADFEVLQFLKLAKKKIPNLAGVKYTALTAHGYQDCLRWNGGAIDSLWGSDEMLLSALVVGCEGAVGSTYNIAAPLYQRIIKAFQANELPLARDLMSKAVQMIRVIYGYPFHSAMRCILAMQGVECGQCRLPQKPMPANRVGDLQRDLESIGFFEWSKPTQGNEH